MEDMNVLIVYDADNSAIKNAAKLIADTLSKENIDVAVKHADLISKRDIEKTNLVVIGSQTTQKGISSKIELFLRKNFRELKYKNYTSFTITKKGFLHSLLRNANNVLKRRLSRLRSRQAVPPLEINSYSFENIPEEKEKIINFAKFLWMF